MFFYVFRFLTVEEAVEALDVDNDEIPSGSEDENLKKSISMCSAHEACTKYETSFTASALTSFSDNVSPIQPSSQGVHPTIGPSLS